MTDLEKTRVKQIIADKLGFDLEEIENDSNLKDDLGMDSLDSIELIMEFEKECNCIILDDDAYNVITVNDVYALLDKSINK